MAQAKGAAAARRRRQKLERCVRLILGGLQAVLKGRKVVHTEFYDPVTRHAYLTADGCDETEVLGVMSSGDEELMQSLLDFHEEQKRSGPNGK